jgi:hypothetical protein
MLTTRSFERLARMQMRALGDEELRLIIVEHPIGGIDAAALEARCADAAAQAADWFEEHGARPRA